MQICQVTELAVKMSEKRNVAIRVSEELHRKVRTKLAEENGDWQNLLIALLEQWVASQDPLPKHHSPTLESIGLPEQDVAMLKAIREWLDSPTPGDPVMTALKSNIKNLHLQKKKNK